ncbi:hypothetical protein [Herbidospora daliensis]|uniref:hypothetical protein n=1 Tax=Herbidospora daliensis TaxID=295585 RepID=UPI00078678DF|nr:hypothetical protein [Herbidospora daliensis]
MTQLTYFATDAEPNGIEQQETAEARDGLRWGYLASDLDRLARMAVSRGIGEYALSRADRYEIAWSAIATELYACIDRPTPTHLIFVGWNAISQASADEARHHGRDRIRHKGTTRTSFWLYWDEVQRYAGSPENGIVERFAVDQIWPALTAGQQEALTALATFGSIDTAAQALGRSRAALHQLAHKGRGRFKELWHEGETPSPAWGRDRRRKDPSPTCPAGHERTDETSYVKHTMRGGKPKQQIICRICREARRAPAGTKAGMA